MAARDGVGGRIYAAKSLSLRAPTTMASRAPVGAREGKEVVMRRLNVLAAVGGMMLLVMVGTGSLAKAAHRGTNGRISFAALPAGHITTMDADGSDVQPLTRGLISHWSPDGRKIAFDDGNNNHVEVFTMNADGSGRQRITHLAGINGDPSWSPDDSLLVFDRLPANGCCGNIWTVHPDGTGLHQVTHFTSSNPAVEPEFSPDGRQIAFFRMPPGRSKRVAIFVMRADGSHIRQVTPLRMDAAHPKWSPDGTKLIINNDFQLVDGKAIGDIFTIRPNGTGLNQITHVARLGEADYRPDYSPDGTMIVFNQLIPKQHPDVLTMNADGTSPKVIHANAFAPDWGPLSSLMNSR
jgi:Tol biopolymer transport system component